jgi:ribonuclease HII
MDKKRTYVVGIDEAGRGPIAGPVAVGGVIIRADVLANMKRRDFGGIRDSKKLTEKKREEWLIKMRTWKKEGKIDFAVSLVSHEMIDTRGVAWSVRKGIATVLKKMNADPRASLVLLDGGIRAPEEYENQKTIIKGDEKEAIISLASIAAKVTRDRKMKRYAMQFDAYGFDVHKGYGTEKHYAAIKRHGVCPIHRYTFLTTFFNIKEGL